MHTNKKILRDALNSFVAVSTFKYISRLKIDLHGKGLCMIYLC